jgi:hypothetical protein
MGVVDAVLRIKKRIHIIFTTLLIADKVIPGYNASRKLIGGKIVESELIRGPVHWTSSLGLGHYMGVVDAVLRIKKRIHIIFTITDRFVKGIPWWFLDL